MKRIRTLGLAAVMALALTISGGVATASASELASEAESTELTGTQSTTFTLSTHAGGFGFGCESGFAFSATQSGKFVKTLATSPGGSGNCGSLGTLNWSNCGLTFYPGSRISAGKFAGTFEIGPANCGPITIKKSGCETKIGPQSGLAATLENQGTGTGRTIKINANVTNLKTTSSGSCAGSGTFEDGTLTGSWSLEGRTIGGAKQLGIYVYEEPAGLHMGGQKSGEEAKQPKFEADKYPATISGSVSKTHSFVAEGPGVALNCGSAQFAASAASSTANLPVGASYTSCSGPLGSTVTVNMNSCHYLLHVANSGPPYTGSADIQCDKAGDTILFEAHLFGVVLCSRSYPAQTLGAASYETVVNEAKETRHVVANVEGTGVDYTNSGSTACGPNGSFGNGSFSGGFELQG